MKSASEAYGTRPRAYACGTVAVLVTFTLSVFTLSARAGAEQPPAAARTTTKIPLFATSDQCLACHNGLVSPTGEDISIGTEWRPGMMANSARDPYWQAAVRREVADHPEAQAAIENECSACHMPMLRFQTKAGGGKTSVFAHLPVVAATTPDSLFANDGVSCSLCHQIQPDNLGSDESFTAGFVVDSKTPPEQRKVFGQYEIDKGRQRIMSSSSSFVPTRATHLKSSEVCATCHTLFTHTLNSAGQAIGSLPEQVPYLEWRHSAYRNTNSCQSCHMPLVQGEAPVSSVLGQPRSGVSRHAFLGGNFFMMRMLNRHRQELGIKALPQELEHDARRTIEHLQANSARLTIPQARVAGDRLEAAVAIESLAGHKLPTAYPSRRVWVHLTIRDRASRVTFESGRLTREGLIEGNDNDLDAQRFEPHYEGIQSPEQVQIYEAIMADPDGAVTTGLLTALRYVKDNRILPQGFDKKTASADVAVHGEAAQDDDFGAGKDIVHYSIPLGQAAGPFQVEVELYYQPIGYRWAQNLAGRPSAETNRFVAYYKEIAPASAIVLARANIQVQ